MPKLPKMPKIGMLIAFKPSQSAIKLILGVKGGQVVCCAGPMLLYCTGFTPCSDIRDVADVSLRLNIYIAKSQISEHTATA